MRSLDRTYSRGVSKKKGADFIVDVSVSSNGSESSQDRAESYTITHLEATSSRAWLAEKKIKRIVYWLESSPRLSEDSHSCRSTTRMELRTEQC